VNNGVCRAQRSAKAGTLHMSGHDPVSDIAQCSQTALTPIEPRGLSRYDKTVALEGGMKRRAFVILAGGAMAWPLAARAQTGSPRRIGFLLVGFSPDSKAAQSFRQGLREAGYVEGRNVIIEWRTAQGDYGRVPALIEDLIQKKVEVIVHDSTVGTAAAKRATSTIPNVMALVLDPVGSGLVKSLANPGGNVTGLSMMTTVDLNSKRLQLLREMTPGLPELPLFGIRITRFTFEPLKNSKGLHHGCLSI
jgi:hypothetical protein